MIERKKIINILEKLGVPIFDAYGQLRPLEVILKDFQEVIIKMKYY